MSYLVIIVGLSLIFSLFFGISSLSSEFVLSAFVPVMIYHNAETEKSKILPGNKREAGVYMWTHNESGKRYVGSAVGLSFRLREPPAPVCLRGGRRGFLQIISIKVL